MLCRIGGTELRIGIHSVVCPILICYSLIATIDRVRLGLFPDRRVSAQPIPDRPSENLVDSNTFYVEDIGQPTTACFLTGTSVDPTNWYLRRIRYRRPDQISGGCLRNTMGCGASGIHISGPCIHGSEISLYYRRSSQTRCPAICFLMGNCGMNPFRHCYMQYSIRHRFGRDSFQEALKISARAGHDTIDWNKFKYMVFDIPTHTGTYQERYAELRTIPLHVLRSRCSLLSSHRVTTERLQM